MNDDLDELEHFLSRWQPQEVSPTLSHRIESALEPRPEARLRWWQRLGFSHPAAAFGWGLTAPAAVVLATLYLAAATISKPASEPPPALVRRDSTPARSAWEPMVATSRQLEVNDDGVVLNHAQRPVRRTRYRSEDTLEWRDPRTGTSLQVSYPREDTVLTPIVTR